MAARKRAANSAVVVQQQRLETKGPVRTALHKLLIEKVERELKKAVDDVQRTKAEYEAALELRAAGQSDEVDNEVRRSWVAMQAAPAVLARMKNVVVPGVRALVDSDEAFAVDDMCTTTASRDVFTQELAQATSNIEAIAVQLAGAFKQLEFAYEQHRKENAQLRHRVTELSEDVRAFVPTFELETSLPRAITELTDPSKMRYAAARTFKAQLREVMGRVPAQ